MRAVKQGFTTMRSSRVKTKDLLVKVKENREKHIREYEEAIVEYRLAVEKYLSEVASESYKLAERVKGGEIFVPAIGSFRSPMPRNHAKDYDQVIMMLEMEVQLEIEVKADEFACYVMDDWDWKSEFDSTVSLYKNSR